MKKILWGFIMILLSLSLVKTDNAYAYKQIINSNDLVKYIENNNLYNINYLCTNDYCDYLRSVNIIRAIDIFKERYLDYLKGKMSEEEALDVIIKGFMITDYKTI